MVPKRAFSMSLSGLYVSLKHKLGIGRHFLINSQTFGHFNWCILYEAGKLDFIYIRRKGCCGYIGNNRVRADSYSYIQSLIEFFCLLILFVDCSFKNIPDIFDWTIFRQIWRVIFFGDVFDLFDVKI